MRLLCHAVNPHRGFVAERIENLKIVRGRAPHYPWEAWTDGSAWRIKRGEDFATPAPAMRSVITAYASRNGLRVQTTVADEDTVEFQFSEPEREAA